MALVIDKYIPRHWSVKKICNIYSVCIWLRIAVHDISKAVLLCAYTAVPLVTSSHNAQRVFTQVWVFDIRPMWDRLSLYCACCSSMLSLPVALLWTNQWRGVFRKFVTFHFEIHGSKKSAICVNSHEFYMIILDCIFLVSVCTWVQFCEWMEFCAWYLSIQRHKLWCE